MDERPGEVETVIGLEVHVQLSTATKMFCGCPVVFGAPPNTATCPVCLGLPGALPVLNRKAVELGLRAALVLECRIHPESQFHRKNYYYPDLPKNYQISQYQYAGHPPLATGGRLLLETPQGLRPVGIRRVHLEEDTGKLVHAEGRSLVDYNRSGTPLMEVVTEPDLRSPEEARQFLVQLRTLLQYAGVTTGRMEEGTLRCDANLSLRRPGGDLVPLRIDEAWIARVRSELPELPDARRRRYVEVFGLPEHDSRLVTATRALADFFEETVRLFPHPKTVSNWLVGEVAAYLNATGLEIEDIPLRPASLAELLALVDSGTLSGRSAKEVLEEMVRTGRSAREIVEERGLVQISDEAALDRIVQDVIAENPGPVADVRAGKDKAVTYLVGQVMKKTRGRANPELVNRLLRERLGAG